MYRRVDTAILLQISCLIRITELQAGRLLSPTVQQTALQNCLRSSVSTLYRPVDKHHSAALSASSTSLPSRLKDLSDVNDRGKGTIWEIDRK